MYIWPIYRKEDFTNPDVRKYYSYYEALGQKGIEPQGSPKLKYPPLSSSKLCKVHDEHGWEVPREPVAILIKLGEMIVWDGHLWHAGAELVEIDMEKLGGREREPEFAYWARLKPSIKDHGMTVYAVYHQAEMPKE